MSERSLIYRHIMVYRFMMNLLYAGKYNARFDAVIGHIKALPLKKAHIIELCFGDTYIATWCKKAGHKWKGLDINQHFVSQARKQGYDASIEDLTAIESLPKADVCIIIGALYHFHNYEPSILKKMFRGADYVIISEPVSNLSSQRGIIGFLARKAANAGKGNEQFRYDTSSLLRLINQQCVESDFEILSNQRLRKDQIITLAKRNGN